jgi:hypothetical protein
VADSIYVPYCDQHVVYGGWPYSDYPAYPYYWGYPSYIGVGIIATGLAFGAAYALGQWTGGRSGCASLKCGGAVGDMALD